ncbi:hypothetical protein H0H93_003537 [Arthromyces matolae]|nr:hypothetical protein H0H93_003537 [Arthromyces matolae]
MEYPPKPPVLGDRVSSDRAALLSSQQYPRSPQEVSGIPRDEERGPVSEGLPYQTKHRNSSWDLFGGIKRLEHSYEEFDMRNSSQPHLVYADGDIPNSKIWGVRLLWWSVWLSVAWGGWWAALAFSMTLPLILKWTFGVVAIGTRKYIDWISALHRYVALFAWTLAIWIAWGPLIDNRQAPNTTSKSTQASDTAARLLFAFFLCSAALLFEKFSIQWIAGKFHERSYAGLFPLVFIRVNSDRLCLERIADQKFAVKSLTTLYRNSKEITGKPGSDHHGSKRGPVDPMKFFKKVREGVRMAATTTTTAFGNVASEIAGSSMLQPNSPQAMVRTALQSANKSRVLARRLFYSFAKPGAKYLLVDDIRPYFSTPEEADHVFSLFDKDMNGDVSREEVEMACLEIHREQLSIEHSMRDLDSAVGRLDNILMSVYTVIAIIIVAVALEAQFATLVTGAGTLILGHPFDVADRVCINKETYTVKEIRLLSTVFLDSNNTLVQAPNSMLNSQNFRRSPHALSTVQMSETFTFDVSYSTTFADLEKLRDKMLAFVSSERRDYQPAFDVTVKGEETTSILSIYACRLMICPDFPDQTKLTLSADIKYKSNWQQGALKCQSYATTALHLSNTSIASRRNKWICSLKAALAELKIYGPSGNPNAPPAVSHYTAVPYDEIKAKERKEAGNASKSPEMPSDGWKLTDKNTMIGDGSTDIFDEGDELYMTASRNRSERPVNISQQQPGPPMPIASVASSSSRVDDTEIAYRR